jgi:hypothetical protein
MRNAEAIQKHWCLVFVAYSFLHLDCLPSSPTKGSLPVKTIGEACRQQAQALIEGLILYAHKGLDQGIGHFMLFEVGSEARAPAPPSPKSPQTSSAASDRKIAPQPSSHQAV